MIALAVIVAVVFLFAVLSPFFWGEGGLLLEGASVNNVAVLRKQKDLILDQYLKEEDAFQKKDLTTKEWSRRKDFFLMRYVDTVRRIDFLNKKETER